MPGRLLFVLLSWWLMAASAPSWARAQAHISSPSSPAARTPSPAPPSTLSATCPSDDLFSEFGAGDVSGGTYVSRTSDGEVILAPAVASEFEGGTLPAGWTDTPWEGGGATTAGGGSIAVEGSLFGAPSSFGPGSTLEFVATFGNARFQHAGFSDDFASSWLIFSTGETTTDLIARTEPGLETTIPGSWLGVPHRFRIDWTPDSVVYSIDGTVVATHVVAVGDSLRPLFSDFNAEPPALVVDWARMAPYASSGAFVSRVFDAGAAVKWRTMSWTAQIPAPTSLAMSVRTGNTPVPDGTWTAFAAVPFSGAALGDSTRYLQYRAQLATSQSSTTPVLEDVMVVCGDPDTIPPVISNVEARAALSGTSATVTWNTDEAADSRVDYGTAPGSLTQFASSATRGVGHALALSGLSPGTIYHYRVTSADSSSNTTTEPVPPAPPLTFTTPPPLCFTDDSAADFILGLANGTYVGRADGGEVILQPKLGAEFSGDSLPLTLGSFPWGAGGTARVANGVVTIDGARVNSWEAGFLSGRSLECVATFGDAPFQHLGFGGGPNQGVGQIFTNFPWAMFSTASGGPVLARTWNGGVQNNQVVPGDLIGTPHRYRIEWNAGSVNFYVDGGLVASHSVTLLGSMRPAASDFATGGPPLLVDWLHMSPFLAQGTYESRIFDAGTVVPWGSLYWDDDLPAGTSLAISTRTGNTPVPDGTWSAFVAATASGDSIAASARYLQYRVQAATSDTRSTPTLRGIGVSCPVGVLDAPSGVRGRSGLAAARPLPFRDRLQLECALAQAGEMSLGIYGVDGRLIRTLASGARATGVHRFIWDGRDERGRQSAAGIYFALLEAPDGRFARRLVRVR